MAGGRGVATGADGATFSQLTPKLLQRAGFGGSGDGATVGTLVWEGPPEEGLSKSGDTVRLDRHKIEFGCHYR